MKTEKLVAAALIRNGVLESRGFKSHREIKAALGDANPSQKNFDDEEGFLTNTGRFVDREEAKRIGIASEQVRPMQRDLLSSDVNW